MANLNNVNAHQAQGFLTIGALANACGVTIRTLRYYEEMDLIGPVKRSAGKYRLYNQQTVKRVNAVLALQALHYSLEEILGLIGAHSASQSYSKAERIQATREALQKQNACLDDKLVSLNQMKSEITSRLKALTAVCEPCLHQKPQVNCHDACEHRAIHLT